MSEKNTCFFARNISELTYHLKNIPDLEIVAGGTQFMRDKTSFPCKFICINTIPELMNIKKNERLIEFGCAIPIGKIVDLETKRMPKIFLHALESIGNLPLRNIATLGGSICAKGFHHTIYASLIALDARLELRNHSDSMSLSLNKFDALPAGYFLSKVRIPLEDWDIEVFERLGSQNKIDCNTAAFALLVKINKNILEDLRIAFAGGFLFRSRQLENILIGSKLPLAKKQIQDFLIDADTYFLDYLTSNKFVINDMTRQQFLNLIKKALLPLL
ncbi:MAG: FAD binding domain-containing protein [Treponemataceae bacterium]